MSATVASEAFTGTGFIAKRHTLTASDSADIVAGLDNMARDNSQGVRFVRTGLGTGWTPRVFKDTCSSRSIAQQQTVKDDHGGIGRAETQIHTLQETFRLLAMLAVQVDRYVLGTFDVICVFLLSVLHPSEVYYCYPPLGFELLCKKADIPFRKGKLLKLKSAVYLWSGSHDWNSTLTSWLLDYGFG